jgi:hypothetical protein
MWVCRTLTEKSYYFLKSPVSFDLAIYAVDWELTFFYTSCTECELQKLYLSLSILCPLFELFLITPYLYDLVGIIIIIAVVVVGKDTVSFMQGIYT